MGSEWTVDTLREMIDARFAAMDRTLADHIRWGEAKATSLEHRLDALSARVDEHHGKQKGIAEGWGYLVGIVGIASSIVAVVISLKP